MDTKHTFSIGYRMFRKTHTEGERECFSAHSYTFYYGMSQLLGCISRKNSGSVYRTVFLEFTKDLGT